MSDPHDDGDDGSPTTRVPDPDPASAIGQQPASSVASDAIGGDAFRRDESRNALPDGGTHDDSAGATDPSTADSDSPPAESHESVVESVDDPELDAVVGERRTLHERVRYQWILTYLFPAVVLGAVVGYGSFASDVVDGLATAVGVGAGAVALVGVYAVVYSVLRYRWWHYVVREDSLYLTRGVFTRIQTVVPYVRVQHIDTRRSAFERVLGLSSLVVYTAGSRGADVTIPGLTPDRAENLQAHLERLAIESEDEDAV